jgi:hypothetical protein
MPAAWLEVWSAAIGKFSLGCGAEGHPTPHRPAAQVVEQ